MSAAPGKAATRAHYESLAAEAVTGLGDTEPGALDLIEHPAITQARDDIALPWWFWEAAAVVFVATVAISAVFPLGFAS